MKEHIVYNSTSNNFYKITILSCKKNKAPCLMAGGLFIGWMTGLEPATLRITI